MEWAVCIEDLVKSYGRNQVLKGVSFSVEKGEIFGLIGVNGAGKTTALECIGGFRRYDRGTISLSGPAGIQLQSAALPPYMRPMEAVELFSRWKRTKADPEVLSALGIGALGKKKYGELSTGQKRRLQLALALLGDPDILLLDEPSAGLDVEGRMMLHRQIKSLRERGKTVLLASHDMAEVEELCGRIGILDQGKIVFCGTGDQLTRQVGKRYTVRVATEQGTEEYEASDIGEELPAILGRLREKRLSVLDLQVSRGTLEQHLVRLVKGD